MKRKSKYLWIGILGCIILGSLIFVLPSAMGQTTWVRSYSGSGGPPSVEKDIWRFVQQTSDGGYIVAGWIGVGDGRDAWVIKLDGAGNIIWQKTYGGGGSDGAMSVQQTSDGGYIVAGWEQSFGAGGDIWVIKLDGAGNIIWQKTYGSASNSNLDSAASIQLTSDGGYIVAGVAVTFSVSAGYLVDPWVIKLDGSGNVIWQKRYSAGPGWNSSLPHTLSMQLTSDGGYIVSGNGNPWLNEALIFKFDSNGNIIWQKRYEGIRTGNTADSIRQTSDGGYIAAVRSADTSNLGVLKLDSNGNIIWQKTYGLGRAMSIQETSDVGYIVVGDVEGLGTMALKLDSNGNIIWRKKWPGGVAWSVQQTSDGGYIVVDGLTGSSEMVKLDRNGIVEPSCAFISDAPALTPVNTSIIPTVISDISVFSWPISVGDTSASGIPSSSITTLICSGPTNAIPTASAGLDQTVHVGRLVTLDGSGSSDPDGNVPLSYNWGFGSVPAGSTAILLNPTSVNPTFAPDIPGDYVIQLVVTDSLGAASSPDSVTISTLNSAPVAEAGSDQSIIVIGTVVRLDGTLSYDVDGNTITYQWVFVSRPTGSAATLTGANTATPTFVTDVYGDYVMQLIVSDPWTQSLADTVIISFMNVAPVANAGTSQSVIVGAPVTLDGSRSSDANGDLLDYRWVIISTPLGSTAVITNPTAVVTTSAPDLAGTYVLQLIVSDGYVDSAPSTVQVQAVTLQTIAVQTIQNCQTQIASLIQTVFKNPNMQNTLLNKLNTVIANIESGNYADALGQLQNDILAKTDGCATTGAPDKNDWIKDCEAQRIIYSCILDAITTVKGLLQ